MEMEMHTIGKWSKKEVGRSGCLFHRWRLHEVRGEGRQAKKEKEKDQAEAKGRNSERKLRRIFVGEDRP